MVENSDKFRKGIHEIMNIECPSCHMTGNINELELPPDGRNVLCPRCKTGFHVVKPPPAAGSFLVNLCPACQYSTFTEEMFAVCPKCGVKAGDHREKRRQEEREQMRHKLEVQSKSHHNPDLVTQQGPMPPKVAAPEQVRRTGWLCIAAGGALLCYGLIGLANYYGKDWQVILSDPLLEPLSKTGVFFSIGFLPWVITLFSACLLTVASQFLSLRVWARKGLMGCAWGGIAVAAIVGAADFINWVKVSSSSPSFSYYAVGVIGSVFMTLLWSVPSCALLWYLERDSILREFPEHRGIPE